jgi:hypothetical protein
MSTRYSGFRSAATLNASLAMEPGTSEEVRNNRYLLLSSTLSAEPVIEADLTSTRKSIASVDADQVRPGDFHPPSET